MYLLTESLRSALTAIRANKLRSMLTTLGIVLGVAAVVAVIALLQGFSQAIAFGKQIPMHAARCARSPH